MTDDVIDVIEAGPRRGPWVGVVLAVVLVALAARSVATHDVPADAAASPSPRPTPTWTIAPLQPVGNLTLPRGFTSAPQATAPLTLTVATDSGLLAIDTADDGVRSLWTTPDGSAVGDAVATADGWAVAARRDAREDAPMTVSFHTARGTAHVEAPPYTSLLPGARDAIWLMAGDRVRRYTTDGHPVGAWTRVPDGRYATTVLADGRLLLDAGEGDGPPPATWRPGERPEALEGRVIASGGALVAADCDRGACALRVTPLVTGAAWRATVQGDPYYLSASPSGDAVAFVAEHTVSVVGRDGVNRHVVTLPQVDMTSARLVWATDGRLVALFDDGMHQVAYAWDARHGTTQLGVYDLMGPISLLAAGRG